jgi:biopolymer transport protein ExbD
MAEKKRFLDVWIVESNTVYREVPFTVVVDWVQQGRLLEDDNLRWSGQADWFRLGGTPAFAAYIPKAEPFRAEDQAEALERVELDFSWKRPHSDDDDDVDMIPLIDVSLVLLVFFMMTTTSIAIGAAINTPDAYNALTKSDPSILWVGIRPDDAGNPVYSLGQGDAAAAAEDRDLKSEAELLHRLDAILLGREKAEVNIKADETIRAGVVRKMVIELEKRRVKVVKKYTGVSAPESVK